MFFSWISDHRQFRPEGIEKATRGFPASHLAMMTLFSIDHRFWAMDAFDRLGTSNAPDASDFPPSSFTLKSSIFLTGAPFSVAARWVHNGYGGHFYSRSFAK
jgi:hypothetical protein